MNPAFEFDRQLELIGAALAQAPFAALIFLPDDDLTLVWRNPAHEVMSGSEGRDVAGLGMFEAFPPNSSDGGDAAVSALRDATTRLKNGESSFDIGPYRFDLPGEGGQYLEHHWQMKMSRIEIDGELVGILQVAQDVTHRVLAQRVAETHERTTEAAAGAVYFSYDPETDRFVRGAGIDDLFGFAPDEAGVEAAPFFARVASEHLPGVEAEIARVMAAPRGEVASYDYRIERPDGTHRFVRIRGEVATDPRDRRPRLVGTFIDLTDIEENRKKLSALVEMKEALLMEANHRIKNSLQMALSMLRLEASQLQRDPGATIQSAVASMSVAESRIRSVASIHGMMRLGDSVARVAIDHLLSELVAATRAAVGMNDRDLVLAGPDFRRSLDSDTAIVFGLIVNELLTNAIKYGWSDGAGTGMSISRSSNENQGEIVLENRKLGEDVRGHPIASSGIGGELVEGFVNQIGGKLERSETGDVYTVRLTFPLPDET